MYLCEFSQIICMFTYVRLKENVNLGLELSHLTLLTATDYFSGTTDKNKYLICTSLTILTISFSF
jgi:hypothetical protein